MKWLILALLIFVAVLTTSLFLRHGPGISAVHKATQAALAVSTSTISEETPVYSIHAAYPVFGIPELDAKIKKIIEAGVADVKGSDTNPSPNVVQNEFSSLFRKPYIGPDVISVELLLSQYAGGAHNNSVAVGINFDPTTKKYLTLDEALKQTGKTLQSVSVLAKEQLTREFGAVQFPEGIAPTKDNYTTFVIEKDAVRFIFQEYQAEAFSAGMPEIRVPRMK